MMGDETKALKPLNRCSGKRLLPYLLVIFYIPDMPGGIIDWQCILDGGSLGICRQSCFLQRRASNEFIKAL